MPSQTSVTSAAPRNPKSEKSSSIAPECKRLEERWEIACVWLRNLRGKQVGYPEEPTGAATGGRPVSFAVAATAKLTANGGFGLQLRPEPGGDSDRGPLHLTEASERPELEPGREDAAAAAAGGKWPRR